METGKLYRMKEWHLLMFLSKENAADSPTSATDASSVDYYSKAYGMCVSFAVPNEHFVILERDGNVHRILSGNGDIGWIRVDASFSQYFSEITAE